MKMRERIGLQPRAGFGIMRSMIRDFYIKTSIAVAAFFALSHVAIAATSVRVDAPLPVHLDGEASAETALPLPEPDARVLRITLTFDMSPTNNVEFSLGNDDDTCVIMGWDYGHYFIRGDRLRKWYFSDSPAVNPSTSAGQTALTATIRFSKGGAPIRATLDADGDPVSFAGLTEGELLAWLALLQFDGLRATVTARGGYENVSLTAAFSRDGSVILVK